MDSKKIGVSVAASWAWGTGFIVYNDPQFLEGRQPKIEFVRGRLKFEQKDDNGNFVSRGTGQHDNMIVVFDL